LAANDYRFVSRWRVLGTIDEVFGLVSRNEALATWWPAAIRDVLELEPGNEDGIGKVVRMETQGWLPYTLHWHIRVDEMDPPQGFAFNVWGDFEGRGAWSFAADDGWVDVGFDWHVQVKKPLVRYLSFLLKPLFASNHRWAMAKGEESLRLALARAHADPKARIALPPPPGHVSYPGAAFAAAGGVLLGAVLLLRRRKSKESGAPSGE
jgi:hypothetical protein